MIHIEATIKYKGYDPRDLTYGSRKRVCCVCDGCGRVRYISFRDYRDMCHLCAHRTEEFCRNRREFAKANCRGENNPMYGNIHSDNSKRLISKSKSGTCLGDKNPNWRGGLSFEPYCEKFNKDFKEMVRERFGRVCFMCDMTEEENGQRLDVHHVNYDKECACNGVECEFVPLCIKCHRRTNHDREMWERLIINVLYYEGWI